MRRGRAPSREPSGSGGPQWDDLGEGEMLVL